jgi:methylenetetrahydrofolate reductase (NADPH)
MTLAALLQDPKFELIPLRNVLEQAAHLPSGATVTVTASPAKGMDATLDLAEQLAGLHLNVVPHLSARLVRDRLHLVELLGRMARAGLRRVFVVGGDAEEPGAYRDALTLLGDIEEEGGQFDEIGVTGYPEGHPLIPNSVLREALIAKAPHADYIATQMCFDPKAIVRWIGSIRQDGIDLPIHLGVPGVADLTKLISISARIGIGDSVRYLRKNSKLLGRLLGHGGFSPDGLLQGLGAALDDPAVGIARLHVFTFNQVEATEKWRRSLLEETTGSSA